MTHKDAKQKFVVTRSGYVPAIIASLVMILVAIAAESQNRNLHEQTLRAKVIGEVALIRARLEGHINGNIQLVRGLVSTLATEPDMDQARFSQLAANLLLASPQVRNIAGAPDLVVKFIHPMAGNERAIGLDYRNNPAQRDAALRSRDTGRLILAGPVDLVQGGTGFIGRFPVFIPDNAIDQRFWGIVSTVMDAGKLYHDAGLTDPDLPIEITLSGHDALGSFGNRFFGDRDLGSERPVEAEVLLPSGNWKIQAVPRDGWTTPPEKIWGLRIAIGIAAALILGPMLVAGRLVEERQGNIAQLRDRESQLARLSRRLDLALDASRVGVWEFNITTGVLVWDERMDELYGLSGSDVARDYHAWRSRLHPDDLERAEEDFRQAIEETGHYNSDYRVIPADNEVRHIRAIGAVYSDTDGTSRIVGVNWDVTSDVALHEKLDQARMQAEARNVDLERARERIEHTALHDALTGLPNRRYLDEVLARITVIPSDTIGRLALIHIDLDRFKQINDTLGHAAGDAMLVHAATVLEETKRPGDFVARAGGDEFIVLVRFSEESAEERDLFLSAFASRIIDRMRQPVVYQGHECRFGVSVGIATQRTTSEDPKRLMVNADIALYRAKNLGRNRYEFFNEALQAEIVRTKRVADDLLAAIECDQFVPFFQPQFDASTLEIVGVEALARWNHPTDGVLAPDAFLKIAQELNVVSTIDRIIMEKAIAQREAWCAQGIHIPRVSVNVSARRLNDDQLIASLGGLKIEPGTLAFELVESIFLDEQDESIAWNVGRIKEFGIEIEIDDFGTGYASIVGLLKLKPQRLKIDRQLVRPVAKSAAQRQLVRSIIDIGRSLGIEAVAEGVESMEHARVLQQLGCRTLQGYAFARPMSADDLAAFVSRKAWLKAS